MVWYMNHLFQDIFICERKYLLYLQVVHEMQEIFCDVHKMFLNLYILRNVSRYPGYPGYQLFATLGLKRPEALQYKNAYYHVTLQKLIHKQKPFFLPKDLVYFATLFIYHFILYNVKMRFQTVYAASQVMLGIVQLLLTSWGAMVFSLIPAGLGLGRGDDFFQEMLSLCHF